MGGHVKLKKTIKTFEWKSGPMYSLDRLPLELIYQVKEPAPYVRLTKEDVDIEATQHTLAALSRTCRHLYAAVQPMLYVCPAVTATNCGGKNDAAFSVCGSVSRAWLWPWNSDRAWPRPRRV